MSNGLLKLQLQVSTALALITFVCNAEVWRCLSEILALGYGLHFFGPEPQIVEHRLRISTSAVLY